MKISSFILIGILCVFTSSYAVVVRFAGSINNDWSQNLTPLTAEYSQCDDKTCDTKITEITCPFRANLGVHICEFDNKDIIIDSTHYLAVTFKWDSPIYKGSCKGRLLAASYKSDPFILVMANNEGKGCQNICGEGNGRCGFLLE